MRHTCVSVITGAVRDSYMLLTQGKKPTLPILLNDNEHAYMKRIVMDNAELKAFIKGENDNILDALDEKNTPQLLDVFDKNDIEAIKEQVKSNTL